MSISDIEVLLAGVPDRSLWRSPITPELCAGRSERMKQRARDGTLNLLERNKGGWNHTAETRQQMKASQKKVWENNAERKAAKRQSNAATARPFHTPYGVFSSIRKASEVLGVKYGTLYSRLYCMSDRYYLGSDSPETRAKISATVVKKKPPSQEKRGGYDRQSIGLVKPIMTPNGLFASRKAAAQAANVDPATINLWMKKFPKEYYYV